MADTDEHMWRLVEVVLGGPDAGSEFECDLCDARLVVKPGDPPPDTV